MQSKDQSPNRASLNSLQTTAGAENQGPCLMVSVGWMTADLAGQMVPRCHSWKHFSCRKSRTSVYLSTIRAEMRVSRVEGGGGEMTVKLMFNC